METKLSLWAIQLLMAARDEVYRSGQSINSPLNSFHTVRQEPQRLRRPWTCMPVQSPRAAH